MGVTIREMKPDFLDNLTFFLLVADKKVLQRSSRSKIRGEEALKNGMQCACIYLSFLLKYSTVLGRKRTTDVSN